MGPTGRKLGCWCNALEGYWDPSHSPSFLFASWLLRDGCVIPPHASCHCLLSLQRPKATEPNGHGLGPHPRQSPNKLFLCLPPWLFWYDDKKSPGIDRIPRRKVQSLDGGPKDLGLWLYSASWPRWCISGYVLFVISYQTVYFWFLHISLYIVHFDFKKQIIEYMDNDVWKRYLLQHHILQ